MWNRALFAGSRGPGLKPYTGMDSGYADTMDVFSQQEHLKAGIESKKASQSIAGQNEESEELSTLG